ncbi:MAG: cyclophilin-like fold protein, partial [Lachnospiraceae bacterium]|nr:cyclophilin-like fold protein [Lachnospiraceae bacterium]
MSLTGCSRQPESRGSEQESISRNTTETEEISEVSITMTSGDTVITAALNDSQTTKEFIEMLPLTLSMTRFYDREYAGGLDKALSENGEELSDFSNGDITYYTSGQALAVFFAQEESSNQGNLIKMGEITSELSLFDTLGDQLEFTIELANDQEEVYDFSGFTNVEITGADLSEFSGEELAVLYQQARY